MADDDHDKDDQNSTDGGTTDGGNDPWAELESDASLDLTEGFSFSFEEVAADAILDEPLAGAEELLPLGDDVLAGEEHLRVVDPAASGAGGDEGAVEVTSAVEASADDDLVNAWLEDPASEDAAGDVFSDALAEQQLAVFSPDESDDAPAEEDDLAAIDRSSIEIGTGESGVSFASGVDEPGIHELGMDDSATNEPGMDMLALVGDDPIEESPVIEESALPSDVLPAPHDGSVAEHADLIDFGTAAVGMAAIGDAAAAGGKPLVHSTAKAAKKSGLGKLLGVLLGGVMAIPITLAILIWGLKQDPLGLAKQVPESLAFLLPAEFQKTPARAVAGGPDLSMANSLDALPAADAGTADSGDREPPAPEETVVAEPDPTAAADLARSEAVVEPPSEASTPVAVEPVTDEAEPLGVAAAAPAAGDLAVAPPQPSLDELETLMPATATAPPAEPGLAVSPPEPVMPEPLDLAGIETAVAEAIMSLDAVHAAADPTSPARNTALVKWYKQLARVAEELAMLEHVAADSGRPLTETPAAVAGLYAEITARPELVDDLARLSRNWLAYKKRSGDGVVVPATFLETKRVGPYWSSRVSLAEAGGRTRELAAISRTQPAAVTGDLILLTGLALDGEVIWAADVRSATAAEGEGGTAGAADRISPNDPDPFGQPGL